MDVAKALRAKNINPFTNGTATSWQNETIVGGLLSSMLGKSFEDDIVTGKANFTDPRFDVGRAESDDEAGWLLLERGAMTIVVNFSDRETLDAWMDSPERADWIDRVHGIAAEPDG